MKVNNVSYSVKGDVLWWIVAALMGEVFFLIGSWVPWGSPLVLGHAGLFLAGLIMGYLKPEKAWRWGIASILLFPIVDFIGLNTQRIFSDSTFESLSYVLFKIPVYLVQTIPALAGASLIVFSRARSFNVTPTAWILASGFCLSFIIGILPLLARPLSGGTADPFDKGINLLWWSCGFVIVAGLVSFFHPYHRLLSSLTVGLGFSFAAIVMILLEIKLKVAAHNLWPLTLLFTLVFGISLAFIGACFGNLLNRLFAKQPSTGQST